MPMMPGKTALLELLKQEGVRIMFGNPGTTELPLMDALAAEQELRYILALQEAPGPMERRKRAVKRAGRLLDVLDSVTLALLDGEATDMSKLQDAIREQRTETDDPALEGVLNEIETRAAVELAKQEVALQMNSRAA